MKKSGFTLVELLAVVILLGVIGSISIGIITKTLEGAKSNINDAQKEMLKNTAELYLDDNLSTHTFDKTEGTSYTEYTICIQGNLVNENYIDKFKNNEKIDLYGLVKIKQEDSGKVTVTIDSLSTESTIETDCATIEP